VNVCVNVCGQQTTLEKKKRQNTKPPEFETPAEKLNCTVQQKCGFFGGDGSYLIRVLLVVVDGIG